MSPMGMKPDKYQLKKPVLARINMAKIVKHLKKQKGDEFKGYFGRANEPKYLYWDKLKYKQAPKGLNPEEAWFLLRQIRDLGSRPTPVKVEGGDYFKWIRLSYTDEFLHKIDISSGGQVFTTMEALSETNRQKFISRGILEEAIASSQLEGAHTTRQAAKIMIVEKKEPRNTSEQMILNNYNTMRLLEEEYKDQDLSLELLFELHKMLTQKTIDESKQGKLRRDEDDVVVRGPIGSKEYTTHIPPKEKFVRKQIKELIKYANDENENGFLHPIIKAIFIHFWIGYLHPFSDGNGRLARALFYWYLLKKGYWTFMYLPISTIIKKAPSQYAMAYIYSEQDSYDLTYFYDFHIRKIMQSLKDFNDYVKKKILENREIDRILNEGTFFNERQKYLVHYLVSEEGGYATATSHATLNNVSRQTATKDLKILGKDGLIEGSKEGKFVKYRATEKLLQMANR